MSENIQCPFNGSCPQTIQNANEIEKLNERMELQNKYIIEKIDTIASDVREVKTFLNEKLDEKVDERVKIALDAYQAKILRWLLVTLLGSGGLSAIISLLLNK